MAFGRIIQLDVGPNNNTGLRVSNLNITFETERSVNFESNYGQFTIINAKKETRDKMLIKNNNIVLRCGYEDEDNSGIIFFGIIIESSPEPEGNQWITKILARDFGNNVDTVIRAKKSFNYRAGTNVGTIITDMANLIDVPVIGIQNVTNIILNNGFTYVGSITNALKKINKIIGINNIGIYFDQTEMIIYRKGEQDSRFGIVSISPQSGLIGEVEEVTDEIEEKDVDKQNEKKKVIRFTSLLNPKIKPNTVIKMRSKKVNGAFIVKRVKNLGDNFGGTFVSQVEAIE